MCVSPNTILQGDKYITVPCNRCFECIRLRKLNWTQRILSESYASDVTFFSLISYNPENYPDPDLPEKKEIQKLIKRLRVGLDRIFDVPKQFQELLGPQIDPLGLKKDSSKPIQLKYFIVSEYGEERNRLHYHAVFFLKNVDRCSFNRIFWKAYLETTWSKGFCSAFYLDYKWATYVCKYIQKSYNMMLYSRLGKSSYIDSGEFGNTDIPSFNINGRVLSAPRSWSKQILGEQKYSLYARQESLKIKTSLLSQSDKLLINEKHFIDNPDKLPPDVVDRYDPSLGISENTDFYG